MPTWAMRTGSETPLASMTSRSGRSGRAPTAARASASRPPMEQQMQPFSSCSTSLLRVRIRAASMLISPKSLTSTATRRPSARSSSRLSKVVLPAPR